MTPPPGMASSGAETSLSVVTWNVDGLDPQLAIPRLSGLLAVLRDAHPHVLLLQEVTYPILQAGLLGTLHPLGYRAVPFPPPAQHYFCLLLSRLPIQASARKPFVDSQMARALVTATLSWQDAPLIMMTAHLESTAAGAKARKRQIRQVVSTLQQAPVPALFGGDTNLREPEIAPLTGFEDAWTLAGAPSDRAYTFDLQRNHNKRLPGAPRKRYDRILLTPGWTVESFVLLGEAPLQAEGRSVWISDHFGIQVKLRPPTSPD